MGCSACRKGVLLLLSLTVCQAGIPECSTTVLGGCDLRVDPHFGNAVALLSEGKRDEVREDPKLNDALCNLDNWKMRSEVCGECPLVLHLVEPEAVAGSKICLADNQHTPYHPNMHMHLSHPLNGKVMEIKGVSTRGYGAYCSAENWDALGNASEAIAITPSGWGACAEGDEAPLRHAAKAGFPLVIEGNSLLFLADHNIINMTPNPDQAHYSMNRPVKPSTQLYRWSKGLEETLVMHAAPTHLFSELLTMVGDGKVVKGKVAFSCDRYAQKDTGVLNTSEFYTDGCPWERVAEVDMCGHSTTNEDRLCVRCPVELEGENGEPLGCLYGPDMIPSRREMFFEGAFAGEFPMAASVVYVSSKGFAKAACTADGWPAEFRGAIVAYEMQSPYVDQDCDWVDPILAAQRAGVKGIVLLNKRKIPGWSYGVRTPLGSMLKGCDAFVAHMEAAEVESVAGFAVRRRTVRFVSGTLPPHGNPPNTTRAPPPLDHPPVAGALDRGVGVATVVLSPLLAVALLATVVRKTHNSSLPKARGLPLVVSSTALSIAMLFLVAATSFALAFQAGRDAVDTASDHGDKAVGSANERNEENVKTLTGMLMNDATNAAVTAFLKWKGNMHFKAKAAAALMSQEPKLWKWFYDNYRHIRTIAEVEKGQIFQVFTTNGFYADTSVLQLITDFRAKEGDDGTSGSVDKTHDGKLYGFFSLKDVLSIPRSVWDPFLSVASGMLPHGVDSVLDLTKGKDAVSVEEGVFHVSPYAHHFYGHHTDGVYCSILHPITVYPSEFAGTVVVSVPCSSLSSAVQDGVATLRNKLTTQSNMTIVIFTEEGHIIASKGDLFALADVKYFWDDFQTHGYRLFTVYDTREVHINALAHVIIERFGWLGVRHVNDTKVAHAQGKVLLDFDQRDYYNGPSDVLIHVALQGNALDLSDDPWDTRVTGSAAECYATVEGFTAMCFDGKTEVAILPYLTTRVRAVRETVVNTSGGKWQSRSSFYNHTMKYDGVDDVISSAEVVGPLLNTTWTSTPVYREPFYLKHPFAISVYIYPQHNLSAVEDDSLPRIIGDGTVGDGVFRWYANGQLKVMVVKRGCTTRPLAIPAHRWSHLVMSVNYREGWCTVYLNGERASHGIMARLSKPKFTRASVIIGHRFEGYIRNLRVHNHSLASDDVQELMKTGRGVAVPSRKWTASIDAILSPGSPSLLVAAMVPTEDILRDVTAINNQAARDLRRQAADTEATLDRRYIEAVLVAVCVGIAAAFVFVHFNSLLTSPVEAFARDLHLTARMDLENISTRTTTSCLREINVMQQGLVTMVANFREFKRFMPMSLIENVKDSASSDPEDDQLTNTSPERSTPPTGCCVTPFNEAAMLTMLQRKKVSFLLTNIVAWHSLQDGMSDSDLIAFHGAYIAVCIATAMRFRGITEPFNGDRVLVTFNGAKGCTTHQLHAVNTCLEITEAVSTEKDLRPLQLTMAITSGGCRVGNMGSEAMRRFTYTGTVVGWTYSVERQCRAWGVPNLADTEVIDSVGGHVDFRHIGGVVSAKHSQGRVVRLSEVRGVLLLEAEEWMYQLQGRGLPHAVWNDVVDYVLKGKWADAAMALSRARSQEGDREDSSPRPAGLLGIEQAVSRMAYTPPHLP